jgi:ectoine hydroxylase-related dioxygenase (phytanoyl-CoA dioxygenase family)
MATALASTAAPAAPVSPAGVTREPRRLTAGERRQYDELGYVVIPDVIPPDELQEIDREIDRLLEHLLAERRARGETRAALPTGHHEETGSILQLGLRSPVCQQVAQDERVLTLVEDIVKPGIAIYSVKLIAKPPLMDVPCHWHQDDAYYVKQSPSETRMSVWVPLQDAHERNGCLYVVPASHEWGLQEHKNKSYGQCRYSMDEEAIREILDQQAVPVPVKAGSAVLFSALLWHGSKGNQTGTVRRAFITSYQEATVPRGNGDQWKIVRPA